MKKEMPKKLIDTSLITPRLVHEYFNVPLGQWATIADMIESLPDASDAFGKWHSTGTDLPIDDVEVLALFIADINKQVMCVASYDPMYNTWSVDQGDRVIHPIITEWMEIPMSWRRGHRR